MGRRIVTSHTLDDISYTVHRRRRRTLALQVSPDGRVQVFAPRYAFSWIVNRFVQDRLDWVREKLRQFQERRDEYPAKRFIAGETFHLWGEPVSLAFAETPPDASIETRQSLTVVMPEGERTPALVRAALRSTFIQQLETGLPEMVDRWSRALAVEVGSVTVADQKRRWGSCATGGRLRFNWRLAMMPRAVVEYVVVHELAHIRVPNHSRQFWQVVESVLPDYRTHRLWLRRHSPLADF